MIVPVKYEENSWKFGLHIISRTKKKRFLLINFKAFKKRNLL